METHDLWTQIESNLEAIRTAGQTLTGEKFSRLRGHGKPREEYLREYEAAERRRQWANQWRKGVQP